MTLCLSTLSAVCTPLIYCSCTLIGCGCMSHGQRIEGGVTYGMYLTRVLCESGFDRTKAHSSDTITGFSHQIQFCHYRDSLSTKINFCVSIRNFPLYVWRLDVMIVMDVIVSAAISSILPQFLCILSYRTNQDPKSESLKGAIQTSHQILELFSKLTEITACRPKLPKHWVPFVLFLTRPILRYEFMLFSNQLR